MGEAPSPRQQEEEILETLASRINQESGRKQSHTSCDHGNETIVKDG